jgi:hypothetical protein
MKNLYACLFFLLFIGTGLTSAWSQTAHSVANGNFYSPLTWDCSCVPYPNYNIVISHDVVMNNDYAFNSGSVTINAGGTLREDVSGRAFAMYSGFVLNNGTFTFTRVGAYGGTFTNNDSMTIYHAFYSGAPLVNTGVIRETDSLYIPEEFTNETTGRIYADKILLTDTLENNGGIFAEDMLVSGYLNNYTNIVLTNIMNLGSITNHGLIHFNDFTNNGEFNAFSSTLQGDADFTNMGEFYMDGGLISLGNNFLNSDSVNHDASFEITGSGLFTITNDFLNMDLFTGTSSFVCIGSSTGNAGQMEGTFDFCDATPPAIPPYIDYNTGTIEAGITYCAVGPCATEIPETFDESTVSVYPNPFSDFTTIEFPNPNNEEAYLIITDITGKNVYQTEQTVSGKIILNKQQLTAGLYFCRIVTNQTHYSVKIIVE